MGDVHLTPDEIKPRMLEISWLEYISLADLVLNKVRTDGFIPEHIAAISRGGLIAGVRISLSMDKPLVVIAAENWPGGKKAAEVRFARHCVYKTPTVSGQVLLVDDLTDTGETLREAVKYLHGKFKDIKVIKTATLFHKETSSFTPDYFGRKLLADPNGLVPWIVKPEENSRIFLSDDEERVG